MRKLTLTLIIGIRVINLIEILLGQSFVLFILRVDSQSVVSEYNPLC